MTETFLLVEEKKTRQRFHSTRKRKIREQLCENTKYFRAYSPRGAIQPKKKKTKSLLQFVEKMNVSGK